MNSTAEMLEALKILSFPKSYKDLAEIENVVKALFESVLAGEYANQNRDVNDIFYQDKIHKSEFDKSISDAKKELYRIELEIEGVSKLKKIINEDKNSQPKTSVNEKLNYIDPLEQEAETLCRVFLKYIYKMLDLYSDLFEYANQDFKNPIFSNKHIDLFNYEIENNILIDKSNFITYSYALFSINIALSEIDEALSFDDELIRRLEEYIAGVNKYSKGLTHTNIIALQPILIGKAEYLLYKISLTKNENNRDPRHIFLTPKISHEKAVNKFSAFIEFYRELITTILQSRLQ